ncbi:hypothetical protein Tco_0956598, partial [Tanacetum coccineum]
MVYVRCPANRHSETSNISSLPTVTEETCIPRGLAVLILNEPRQVSLTVYTVG